MFVCSECGASQPGQGQCPADGTPLAAIGDDLLLGTTIGAYRVARLLGVGGMGRVYKGVHPTIGSRVAIKVLSRECSDRRDLVDRFFAEAKAVNVIRHESIVNVLDLSVLPDGRPFIIMEYLDGAPLAAIIEHAVQTGQPLPIGGLARLAVEVLDALAAAHGKGIVHRDLKPDNIFVTPSGRPKVLDFGIAKLSDLGAGSATRTGSLLGTPHYMSPEQAAGKVVDHRADIYAMGVILFETATGQKPFLAESLFDLLRKHVEVPPPPPRSLRPDLPPEVESVILTAMAKAPEHRFASAQAMSMALQHATAQLAAPQWVPITGGGTHRAVPSGGWHPTPPASWGGTGGGAGGTGPGREPARPAVTPSTMGSSAGQVQPRPPGAPGPGAPSRKGLWLGLGAVLLVGGGVAAAVLAGGGGGSGGGGESAGPVAGGEPGGSDGAGAGDKGQRAAGSAGGEAAPGAPAGGAGGKADPAGGKAGKAGGDGDSDGDGDGDGAPAGDSDGAGGGAPPPPGDDADRAFEAALANLDAIDVRALPPAARKQMAELKKLAKLPPKQRLAKLKELARAGGLGPMAGLGDLAGAAEADDPDAQPQPRTGPGTPGAGNPPRAAGSWVSAGPLSYGGFDPKRVDVSAFVAWAIAEARKADPDAVLFRIDVSGVGPEGLANLELPTLASDHGSLDLRFYSPARSARDPNVPLGVPSPRDKACEFRIEAEPDGVRIRPIPGFDCKGNEAVPPPRCTAAALWKRAIAARAPRNAVASLGYRAWSGKAKWYFDIGSGSDRVFSHVFDDGC